jgi:hypothetical protein
VVVVRSDGRLRILKVVSNGPRTRFPSLSFSSPHSRFPSTSSRTSLDCFQGTACENRAGLAMERLARASVCMNSILLSAMLAFMPRFCAFAEVRICSFLRRERRPREG